MAKKKRKKETKMSENDNNEKKNKEKNDEKKNYYEMCREQIRWALGMAVTMSFLGAIIYMVGIGAFLLYGKDISTISIIGGTSIEILSGIFFWLYKDAIHRYDIRYYSLTEEEKYNEIQEIIEKLQGNEKGEMFKILIQKMLSRNEETV